MPLIASIYLVLQVLFFFSYYMMVMNILTPDDNELSDKCINKQISLITFSYIDTWEAVQEDAVRVIELIAKPDSEFWTSNHLFHRFWYYVAALESLPKEDYKKFV